MKVQAVIFDLDGVLTDTAEGHYLSWQRVCDEEGIPFTRQMNEQLRGRRRADSLRLILGERQVDEATFNAILARKNAYYLEYLETLTPEALLPGIPQLLDALDAAGIPYAVGSASRNARRVLTQLGVLERFAFVGDGNTVARAKPAPDLFLAIAQALDVSPAASVVVEDAQAGVEAALRGGFGVVGMGPAERVGAAHVVVPDTAALSLDCLQEALKRRQFA